MEDIKIILGRNIRQERKKRALTQIQLSVKAEVSLTSLRAAESGSQNVTIDTVVRIASALGTSLIDLLKC